MIYLLGNDSGGNILTGGPGRDTVKGFLGDDRLEIRDGVADLTAWCNGGTDTVNADAADPVGSDCEIVNRF